MARKTTKTRNALTYETLPALFTGICDAIRTKTGGSDPIAHQSIPSAISEISAAPTIAFDLNTNTGTTADEAYTYTVAKDGKLYGLLAGVIYSREAKLYKNDVEVTPTVAKSTTPTGSQTVWCKTYREISVETGDVLKITWTSGVNYARVTGAYMYII